MHHIGILGHSAEGAAECFRAVCAAGLALSDDFLHPDVSLDCRAFGHAMAAWEAGDLTAVRAMLGAGIDRLAAAGADFFICPDNTAHLALELEGEALSLPGLHLPSLVADRAVARDHTRVGVLGTRFTMDSSLYERALGSRDIDSTTPGADDRALVDRIIFGELVHGVVTEQAVDALRAVTSRLQARGCDAVALVCTELPMALTDDTSPLPVLDSTALSADGAFRAARCDSLPHWRGGDPRRVRV